MGRGNFFSLSLPYTLAAEGVSDGCFGCWMSLEVGRSSEEATALVVSDQVNKVLRELIASRKTLDTQIPVIILLDSTGHL